MIPQSQSSPHRPDSPTRTTDRDDIIIRILVLVVILVMDNDTEIVGSVVVIGKGVTEMKVTSGGQVLPLGQGYC